MAHGRDALLVCPPDGGGAGQACSEMAVVIFRNPRPGAPALRHGKVDAASPAALIIRTR